jgi:hypothetical protein
MIVTRTVLVAACAAPLWLCGCLGSGDDSSTLPPDAAVPDAGKDSSVADVAVDVVLDTWTPPASTAYVRLANWSANAPAFDLCLAPHGSGAFFGPLLSTLAAQIGTAGTGMGYPMVSSYVSVPPARYDARLAVGGDTTCGGGILPDMAFALSFGATTFHTIAVIGNWTPASGEQGPAITSFDDRWQLAQPGLFETRFINAYAGAATVDLWSSGEAIVSLNPNGVIFQGVPFGQASSSATLPSFAGALTPFFDGNYRIGPMSIKLPFTTSYGVAIGSTPLANLMSPTGVTISSPAIVTVAVVGAASAPSPHLLRCIDNAGAAGLLSACCSLDLDCDSTGADPTLLMCCSSPSTN